MLHDIPTLSVQALTQFATDRAADAPVLLDVREPWEREAAAFGLPGIETVAIPMAQLPMRLGELDPRRPVLGLCHHGMRSLQCVAFLQRQGFAEVYNVQGGIDAWSLEVDPAVPRY